ERISDAKGDSDVGGVHIGPVIVVFQIRSENGKCLAVNVINHGRSEENSTNPRTQGGNDASVGRIRLSGYRHRNPAQADVSNVVWEVMQSYIKRSGKRTERPGTEQTGGFPVQIDRSCWVCPQNGRWSHRTDVSIET